MKMSYKYNCFSDMTEGPETTYLANYISRRFKGRRLRNVLIRSGRYKTHGPPTNYAKFKGQLPLKLTHIYKKGKVIFLFFENNWTLIVKLGMVGWFFTPRDRPEVMHGNVEFQFDNNTLYFSDFRNFGTLTFTDDMGIVTNELSRLAPDILDENMSFDSIRPRIEACRHLELPIEDALMDQTLLFSGIGNIIKSEALYDAKIAPGCKLRDMSDSNWRKIYNSSRRISLKVRNFLEKHGFDLDKYIILHKVYNREVDPHGNKVYSHISAAGRRTYWVPSVQK